MIHGPSNIKRKTWTSGGITFVFEFLYFFISVWRIAWIKNIHKLTKSCRLSSWWQKPCNDLFSPSLNPSFTPIDLIADQANPLLFLLCFFFYHSFYIPFLVFTPPSSFLPLPLERISYGVNLWQMRNPMDGRWALTDCQNFIHCLFIKWNKTRRPYLHVVQEFWNSGMYPSHIIKKRTHMVYMKTWICCTRDESTWREIRYSSTYSWLWNLLEVRSALHQDRFAWPNRTPSEPQNRTLRK